MVDINQTLIERARSGHRESLDRLLVSRCAELRAHIARRMPVFLQEKVSEEDVMQEALTQAYLKIDGLLDTTPRAFVRWLTAIGEMSLVDFIRIESRQKRGGRFRRQRYANESIKGGSLVNLLESLPSDAATASQAIARE